MSFWRALRRPSRVVLPVALVLLLPLSGVSAASDEGSAGSPRNYIVTLSVTDAGKAIRPVGRSARQRIRRRAARTTAATDRLAREGGFRTRNRYRFAVSGFSARLTPRQANRLRSDPQVASIRPARRFRTSSQIVPGGIKRTRAAPAGGPAAPDVDVDIAILDTGIGPVGNNELNVRGGKNCAGDGLGDDAWQDLNSVKHGTHVAGIAAARDNNVGVVGVAPGARLWAVRVFRSSGFGDESSIVCGLDWAVSTRGPGAPPGTQPIEVINMSIQGPRVSGAPEACVGASDPDPIHAAVCAATAAGITVVVAAGNDGSDTDQVSPAGYDQAITVGALSDFDGLGDSQATTACEFFEQEVDDSYARYSNYGDDVDIVAPGTCITSTFPSASGDETQVLTGTSMATPHVAGAAARYLATNPTTTPSQMRKLIRASGRLDWLIKTDPHWFGVNDADAPNRVLDVKALLGAPGLRAWVSSANLKIGGTDKTRAVRVDVQRIGGYDGDVQLGVAGLPGAVGTASFDRPGATLSGLGGLGARLVLSIKQSAPDGNTTLQVEAMGPGGNPAASRGIDLLVDRTGPASTALTPRIRGGRAALPRNGAAVGLFRWTVGDAHSKVKRSSLQRKVGGGPWKDLGRRNKNKLVATTVKPGKAYSFRVRSRDGFGNVAMGKRLPVRMIVRSANSTKWLRPSSGWVTRTSNKALRGSRLAGTKSTGKLATTFDGMAVAVVAPLGPKRGKIRVRVDGGKWQPVNLKAAKGANRRVVFSRRLAAGSHELEIEVRSGQVAIDAILILR